MPTPAEKEEENIKSLKQKITDELFYYNRTFTTSEREDLTNYIDRLIEARIRHSFLLFNEEIQKQFNF